MPNRPHKLKIGLIAAIAGLSLVAGGSMTTPAAARTVCNGYGQCWYVRDSRDYYRYYNDPYYWSRWHGSYRNSYYDYERQGYWRWDCDSDGDNCRWVFYRDYDRWGY